MEIELGSVPAKLIVPVVSELYVVNTNIYLISDRREAVNRNCPPPAQ